ncbi:hypothetical protein ABH932_002515 [Streptacidiphilus sp. MAP5-52]
MALRFVGVDPETNGNGSPTVWTDPEQKELVLQGLKLSPKQRAEVEANQAPGHDPIIPDNEDVIRVPARLIPFIRKACDELEQL